MSDAPHGGTYVSHPTHITGVFLRRIPKRNAFIRWGGEVTDAIGCNAKVPDTLTGASREARLQAASIEAAGTDTVSVRLAVCMSFPLG
jgi:hypothetical protein